ncbi:MAG: hypothetical protein WA151_07135 [Desulfatirhabdiaceae bacterium]
MIKTIITGTVLILASTVFADELPWPKITMGKMALPYDLQWYTEDAKDKVVGYGEPRCTQDQCAWMFSHPDGTIFLTQEYQTGTLVGFRLHYILTREAGLNYRKRIRFLKEQSSRCLIGYPKDILRGIVIPDENYVAECEDTRINVNYREGEYSVEISLELKAK